MAKTLATENCPRIASYQVPAGTWILCIVMLGIAACTRLVGGGNLRQVAAFSYFALGLVNALNFLIPLLRPRSILGGAKMKTLALATFAVLGMLGVH